MSGVEEPDSAELANGDTETGEVPEALFREKSQTLEKLVGVSRPWTLAEDVTAQQIILDLLALIELEVGSQLEHYDLIVRGFEKIEQPGLRLRLSMASFFHHLGAEERRDDLLAGVLKRDSLRPRELVIRDLKPISIAKSSGKKSQPLRGKPLNRGYVVTFEAILEGVVSGTRSGVSKTKIRLESRLVRKDGTIFDNSRPFFVEDPEYVGSVLPLKFGYQVPARTPPGPYDFELEAYDVNGRKSGSARVPVAVR